MASSSDMPRRLFRDDGTLTSEGEAIARRLKQAVKEEVRSANIDGHDLIALIGIVASTEAKNTVSKRRKLWKKLSIKKTSLSSM